MTEASLCKKSYFGTYLRYRLGRMKGFLIVGLILNFVVLPLQGLLMLIRANRLYNINVIGSGGTTNYTVMVYITMFGAFAAIISLAFTMVCAVSSYNFFCKKECVDTLGVLAVTYKQRFWGDFLGGFIPCVGLFIPSALIGIIFTAIAQNKLNTFTVDEKYVNIMPFFLGFTLMLFFAYLFIYLLTTLAAACCGRISSMIIFTVISFAAIPVIGISLTKYITLEAIMEDTLVNHAQQLFMPAGLFFSDLPKALAMMIDERNTRLLSELSELEFAVLSPVSIVILVVAAALILALAYFAGKSRKQENVGRMFVKPVYFHIVTIIMSLGGFFIVADAFRNFNRRLIIPIGLGVSLVIAVIFEVIRRPKARQLPKVAARWIITAACGIGLMFLISKTGAFGMINIPKNVQSVRIEFSENGFYRWMEITDREEIAEFVDAHNKNVLKNSEFLCYTDGGGYFYVKYIAASGDEVYRSYHVNQYRYDHKVMTTEELAKNIMRLSFYPHKLAEMLDEKAESASASMSGIFREVPVPTECLDEFTQTLRQDILDHYDVNGNLVGSASVRPKDSDIPYSYSYAIQSSYENTIRLIDKYNGDIEEDLDAEVLDINCYLFEKAESDSDTYMRMTTNFNVIIRKRDMNKPKVEELLELMVARESGDDDNFGMNSAHISIRAENGVIYYIPDADKNHAAKLIAQIAAELVE